jgi:hypothetical protein
MGANDRMPTIELEYPYTAELARRSSRRFMRRYGRSRIVIVCALVLVALIRILNGFDDTLTFLLFATPFMYAWMRYSYTRRAELVAAKMGDPTITLTADEQTLTFRTTDQLSARAWRTVGEVWQFADVWLFFPLGAQSGMPGTPVPTEALSTEARAFISTQLRDHGTRVIQG